MAEEEFWGMSLDEYWRAVKKQHVADCGDCGRRTWHQLHQRNGEKVWLCLPCRLDETARERRRRYEGRVAKTI